MDEANQVQSVPPSSHIGKVLCEDVRGLVHSGTAEEQKDTLFVRIMQLGDRHTVHPSHVTQRGVLTNGNRS